MRIVALALGLGIGSAGCTASSEDVRPPEDTLFFPTGAGIAPDESVLFVANANSELRYDSGSVVVLDLATIDQVANAWTTSMTRPDNCQQDTDHTETLNCGDETVFMRAHAGARVGNFATDVAVQDTGNGTLRLIVPTRGDPSISWVEYDGTTLTCAPGSEGYALCDDAHRLTYVQNDPDLAPLPDEPFSTFVDSVGQFAIITHLTSGDVSLVDTEPGRDAIITDVAVGLFNPDPLTGLTGSTGVAGRTPSMPDDVVYVGSRSEDRIQTMTVGRPANGELPFLLLGNWFFLTGVGGFGGGSTDTRGMSFSSTGDRLYLVNREPPTLQIIDTSLSKTGFPVNAAVAGSPICRQASTLTVLDPGDGERVYVTCFQDGEIYVVNPSGQSQVEDIIEVGRGPYAVVASKTRDKLYVTNFLEDTIAVIDVSPTSPLRDRVVMRIGEVREP